MREFEVFAGASQQTIHIVKFVKHTGERKGSVRKNEEGNEGEEGKGDVDHEPGRCEHFADAIVSDGEEDVDEKALKHIAALILVVLFSQKHLIQRRRGQEKGREVWDRERQKEIKKQRASREGRQRMRIAEGGRRPETHVV